MSTISDHGARQKLLAKSLFLEMKIAVKLCRSEEAAARNGMRLICLRAARVITIRRCRLIVPDVVTIRIKRRTTSAQLWTGNFPTVKRLGTLPKCVLRRRRAQGLLPVTKQWIRFVLHKFRALNALHELKWASWMMGDVLLRSRRIPTVVPKNVKWSIFSSKDDIDVNNFPPADVSLIAANGQPIEMIGYVHIGIALL